MSTTEEITLLERKLRAGITEVKERRKTPEEIGIGKMLIRLQDLDIPSYEEILKEWKPVSDEYFDEYRRTNKEYLAKKAKERKRAEEAALRGTGGGGISDNDLRSGPKNHQAKEAKPKKVKAPKAPKPPKPARDKGDRDRKSYKFNDAEYGKGQLVLAVVRHHVAKNPGITLDQIKSAFPDALLKGYGILQEHSKAIEISKNRKRFFLNDAQLVQVKGAKVAICNQFSSDNIHPFLDHAKNKLGYTIE